MTTTTSFGARRRLNGSRLVRTIRKYARQHPDRIAACVYSTCGVHGEPTPQCIVGYALHDLDVDLRKVKNGMSFENLIAKEDFVVSDRYARWVDVVQSAQDGRQRGYSKMKWADAVAYADKRVGKVW